MKTLKIIFVVTILLGLTLSCSKKIESPEQYSSYLSMQISNLEPLTPAAGNSIQMYLRNDSEKEFEKECMITYSLRDTISGLYYTSENLFYNKLVPDLPNGVYSLKQRDAQFININLKDLIWKNIDYESIKSNHYLFEAQLFIRDPFSLMNIINSNRITIIKE